KDGQSGRRPTKAAPGARERPHQEERMVKHVLLTGIIAVAAAFDAGPAAAQPYPDRPIKLIVPLSAGGPPDVVARVVADQMGARLGQTVVVENKPGAGATIGTRAVAAAEPDGYTLLFASTTALSIAPAVFK